MQLHSQDNFLEVNTEFKSKPEYYLKKRLRLQLKLLPILNTFHVIKVFIFKIIFLHLF